MSVNNRDRYEKKCVLCNVRNAQCHSYFCSPCEAQCKVDAGLRETAKAWLNAEGARIIREGDRHDC